MISPLWLDGPFQVNINGTQVLGFFRFVRVGLDKNLQTPATGFLCPQFRCTAGGVIGQGLANPVFVGEPLSKGTGSTDIFFRTGLVSSQAMAGIPVSSYSSRRPFTDK